MNDCYYCAWRNGHHDPHCPQRQLHSETVFVLHKTLWEAGYKKGRGGQEPTNDDPVYMLGYGRGVVALEEAENGFDPVIEGRQW